MVECNGCEYFARIQALEKSSERNSAQHEKMFDRLNFLEKQNGVTDYQFSQIMKTLDELKKEVSEIKDKPSKRWDTIVNAALQWIVVAVLAAVVIFK